MKETIKKAKEKKIFDMSVSKESIEWFANKEKNDIVFSILRQAEEIKNIKREEIIEILKDEKNLRIAGLTRGGWADGTIAKKINEKWNYDFKPEMEKWFMDAAKYCEPILTDLITQN